MSVINHLSEPWFAWVIASSWQLALLVCLVAVLAGFARTVSARLRYSLWLLVLVKVFLPPTLSSPYSMGAWAVGPVLQSASLPQVTVTFPLPADGDLTSSTPAEPGDHQPVLFGTIGMPFLSTAFMIVWAIGCATFWLIVGWRFLLVSRIIRSASLIEEGPNRILLERVALRLPVRRVPDLLKTGHIASPFLFGVIRPRIVLPDALLSNVDDLELEAVFTHELAHCRRYDTAIGWLQAVAQSLFWFHPFVWWANGQLRHACESICDEEVLRQGQITPERYSESIVRVLTVTHGRSLAGGSLVGVFERGAKLQNRLEDIMSYEPRKRRFGWTSRLAVAVIAILCLPLSPPSIEVSGIVEANESEKKPAAPEVEPSPYPQIVETIPKIGQTAVSPSLKEISVKFDRDMAKGMSWTGGGADLPQVDKGKKPRWTDARTCVLPVKLEKGKYYRIGINSKSNQNFRSQDGAPVPPAAVYFTTEGADKSLESRVEAPTIVEMTPKNGATDVDPQLKTLTVKFSAPMGEGMSWTGGGATYPKSPSGQKARWSADGLTCTLPVTLEAGREYVLGLNSLNHNNFQSKWGVPLAPIEYNFKTRAN